MERKGQRRGCRIRDFGIVPSPRVRKQEFWGWRWGMGGSNKTEERCEEQRGNKAGFKIGKSIY